MKYLMSGRDRQIDGGFGINAEAFIKSADFLFESKDFMDAKFIPQKHMPVFFLYRHSIELFLKSMIVIFHKELTLPSLVSEKKIMINGKALDKCHWIDALYLYWENIMTEQKEQLEKKAPDGSWEVFSDLGEKIELIAKYDKDSTFFRYPFTKNNTGQDDKKYAIKKEDDLANLEKLLNTTVFILKDENENIVDIYSYDENTMSVELEIFKETASSFYRYHRMVRNKLCEGF